MCMMELVDYNTLMVKETSAPAKKAKTTRRGKTKKADGDGAAEAPVAKKAKAKKADTEEETGE